MSILSDNIVYIWLLPVVAQIILPLGMLVGWLAAKPIRQLISRPAPVASPGLAKKST